MSAEDFIDYIWTYYNPEDGIYPIEGLTKEMIEPCADFVRQYDLDWCGGDTEDRISAINVVLARYPQLKFPDPA